LNRLGEEQPLARRKEAHGGGHGWFVTFADLMGLLVSFFVMLVAFSSQDAKKMQAIAGSMRDAFGVQSTARFSGVVELDGLPTRTQIKNAAPIRPEDSSNTPTPNEKGSDSRRDGAFALAAASLRQMLQGLPELTEASRQIMIAESQEGLNIEIVDQDGRAMFPERSMEPYEHTRQLIQRIAEPLKAMPYRISITGHTSSSQTAPHSDNDQWSLSVARANAVRQILEEEGYPSANIYKVAGKGASDPLFPDDRTISPNRRVTITLIREASPVPPDLKP
jgi:chemotaxis protein MotB